MTIIDELVDKKFIFVYSFFYCILAHFINFIIKIKFLIIKWIFILTKNSTLKKPVLIKNLNLKKKIKLPEKLKNWKISINSLKIYNLLAFLYD